MVGSKGRINFIKNYFREEMITFRSWTVIYLALRIAFDLLVMFTFNCQWCMMYMGAVFSVGFVHNTEVERILPLTDAELKQKRFVRVNMVWLRYLILGILGYVVTFIFPKYQHIEVIILKRPCMYFALFILQMTTVYQSMFEHMLNEGAGKNFSVKQPVEKYVFSMIPMIIFFVYGISSIRNTGDGFFFTGAEWVHVLIMLTAALLSIIYNIILYKKWEIRDFNPELVSIKAAKGGAA